MEAGDKKDRRDWGRYHKEGNIAPTVVCLICHNKVPYAERIMRHRNAFSTFQKLRSLRSRCQQILGVVRAFFSGSQTMNAGYVLTQQKHLVSSLRSLFTSSLTIQQARALRISSLPIILGIRTLTYEGGPKNSYLA